MLFAWPRAKEQRELLTSVGRSYNAIEYVRQYLINRPEDDVAHTIIITWPNHVTCTRPPDDVHRERARANPPRAFAEISRITLFSSRIPKDVRNGSITVFKTRTLSSMRYLKRNEKTEFYRETNPITVKLGVMSTDVFY